MEKPNVYIIIVTYNGMPWINTCLASCGNYPVIIVDNASTDDTISFIETNYPEITILKQIVNLGFGQANNIGISYALEQGAEHVFLLNQDAYLDIGVIDQLLNVQRENKHYGILSPIHCTRSKNKLDKNFAYYVNYENSLGFYSDHVLHKQLNDIYDIPFVNAASWLLTKECIETIGGFDPIFYHYGEDENYCQRAIFHGFSIGIVPKTYIIHDREDRDDNKPIPFTKDYFELQNRNAKIRFANVNVKNPEVIIDKEIRDLNRKSLKCLIQLKFKYAKGYNVERIRLKGVKTEIIKSYQNNRVEGKQYIN
jgi:GT2 family glycosyltransferase